MQDADLWMGIGKLWDIKGNRVIPETGSLTCLFA